MTIQLMATRAGEREVRFTDRQETTYPHLMRLCLDFNFRVLQRGANSYQLSTDDAAIMTPAFDQLAALECHVHQHLVDILHSYLAVDAPQVCAH
jgi:hypothetical protein